MWYVRKPGLGFRICTINNVNYRQKYKRMYDNRLWNPTVFKQIIFLRPSQCPLGLRRMSAAARFLGLRVQIPPGTWISVKFVLSGTAT
jgi:hypothetical protein